MKKIVIVSMWIALCGEVSYAAEATHTKSAQYSSAYRAYKMGYDLHEGSKILRTGKDRNEPWALRRLHTTCV